MSLSVAAAQAAEMQRLQEENRRLRKANASRPVIDQARGVLMATTGCTSDQAWDILCCAASHNPAVRLRDIADSVVAGLDESPPAGPVRAALRQALLRHRVRREAGVLGEKRVAMVRQPEGPDTGTCCEDLPCTCLTPGEVSTV
ncbi:ANTAR domain-containing protein [Streptomyces sp. ACA25]|uniref:ANTAR domain-containing protein n=1 Tax=Streptomyces sp. ACA25 TaxID=3022596 RepID=UPI0023073F9B|nr:ANTAR domain-containing protein [Streptomyces sp. ACA25]MDB1087777.1 ANTAR domain-containing protein [Streptomyces sp. ACA25]